MRPDTSALVLGSGQRSDVVNIAAARQMDVPVLRRRSGGGAVLVRPGDLLWVDVLVPRSDPLWHPDVGRAFEWLGRAWQEALAACGVAGEVHTGPYEPGPWGSLVCFAGRGPGEVSVDGAKVLGLSQRRNSACARFQSGLLRHWTPEVLAGLFALPVSKRSTLERHLAGCAGGVPLGEDKVLSAFQRVLTS